MLLTSKKSALQHISLTISWILVLFAIGWLDFVTPGLSLMIFYVLIVIVVSLVLGAADGTMSAIAGAVINYAANMKDPGIVNPDLKIIGSILSFFILVIIELIVIQLKKSSTGKKSCQDWIFSQVRPTYVFSGRYSIRRSRGLPGRDTAGDSCPDGESQQ